jgi:hypothetical protein
VVAVTRARLLLFGLALACPRPAPQAPPDAARSDASVPARDAAADRREPAALAPPDRCAALRTAFAERRAAGGACKAAADCACHPDVGIEGWRAASDAASARELTRIANEYRQHECPTGYAHGLPPGACKPQCRDGRCVLP